MKIIWKWIFNHTEKLQSYPSLLASSLSHKDVEC